MKWISAAAALAVATIAFSGAARAEDNVRVCIAASTEGQSLQKQGKLLAAREQMIACARDACPAIVRSHCAKWLDEVDAAIPSVVVRAEDGQGADALGARVTIDGRASKLDGNPVRLDPGEHTVAISGAAGEHKEERVLLAQGERSRVVTLQFPTTIAASAPADRPTPRRDSPSATRVPVGAWILGGVGVLALGGAAYFGFAANGKLGDLQSTCSPHCTDAEAQPGRTDALLFDVFLGAGAAAVAGALVWALVFPDHAAATPTASASASTPRVAVLPLAGGGAYGSIGFAY